MVIFSSYVRRSLPFVSRFTSILMLEGSQLRLLILFPYYLYIYHNQKRNGENFHMVRHSYRKHLIKFLLYINRNSRMMHCSEAVLELYLVF